MIFALIFCVVFFLSLSTQTGHSNLVGQQNTANGLKDSIRAGLGATGVWDRDITNPVPDRIEFLFLPGNDNEIFRQVNCLGNFGSLFYQNQTNLMTSWK